MSISKERLDEIKNFPETFTDPECPVLTEEQLVEEYIGELEDLYRWLSIREGIREGTIKTYTMEEAERELGL